jgi:hypothetical protein
VGLRGAAAQQPVSDRCGKALMLPLYSAQPGKVVGSSGSSRLKKRKNRNEDRHISQKPMPYRRPCNFDRELSFQVRSAQSGKATVELLNSQLY